MVNLPDDQKEELSDAISKDDILVKLKSDRLVNINLYEKLKLEVEDIKEQLSHYDNKKLVIIKTTNPDGIGVGLCSYPNPDHNHKEGII